MSRNKIHKEPSDQIEPRNASASPQSFSSAGPSSSSAGPSFSSHLAPPALSQRARAVLRKPVGNGNRSSVRIRRSASSQSINQVEGPPTGLRDIQEESTSRRRSSSEPQRPGWVNPADHPAAAVPTMASLPEDRQLRSPRPLATQLAPHLAPHVGPHGVEAGAIHAAAHAQPHLDAYHEDPGMLRRANVAARSALGMRPRPDRNESDIRSDVVETGHPLEEYDEDMVDLLDVIDPEVSTLSTLTNVQNSLFIPDLGGLLNRRPTYNLTRPTGGIVPTGMKRSPKPPIATEPEEEKDRELDEFGAPRPTLTHMSTISSTLSESRYAVLPHGQRLSDNWTEEEKAELNDMVRHMLHSRRAAFKRSMKGFKQYVKKPLGLFVTIYATLITLFGLAWVLFLIGWISVGNRKDYLVDVIDNVLVALFAVMGDGLVPFRTVDTYHMIYIAHYHHLTWSLRKKQRLAKLEDHNDLPDRPLPLEHIDVENEAVAAQIAATEDKYGEVSVLSSEQQRKLEHHQKKFSRSHTFYKPHETDTHHAFPLRLLIAIVVILDCHSLLQIALGTCTWAIDYHNRPFALTTVILCFSISCNITGGILISIGDRRTRKKDVIERMFRQDLTTDAIRQLEIRKLKERVQRGELDESVLKEVEKKNKPKRDASVKKSWKTLTPFYQKGAKKESTPEPER